MQGLSSLRAQRGNPEFGAIGGGGMKLSLRDFCGSLRPLREPDYFFFAQRTQRAAEGAEVLVQVQGTSLLRGGFLFRAFLRLCVNTTFFFSHAKAQRKRSIYRPGSNIVECAADVLRLLGHNMPPVGE
jgi:hypothetical protein